MKWPEIKEIATRLRNNPSPSEEKLWEEIRNRKLSGRKFLRQHPIIYDADRNNNEFFFFIPDFYCASEKLIIELDGKIHEFQKDKDYLRDEILRANNLKVIRLKNAELESMESTLQRIIQAFRK
jgi:very-short-patch-repair endonuclease